MHSEDLRKRVIECGHVMNLEGRGRKRIMSARAERRVVRRVKQNPRITAGEIVEEQRNSGVNVSRQTIGRVLKRASLKACRPRKTPLLKPVHLKARLEIAKCYIDKDAAFWKCVLWSDETKFELFGHNSVASAYRKSGETFLPKNTMKDCNISFILKRYERIK